jgi:hypothetical protein
METGTETTADAYAWSTVSKANIAADCTREGGQTPERRTATTSSTITIITTTPICLDTVLGLRCLSIVLSYLEECEGTSFLLTQKKYWTDTILPLLKVPPEACIGAGNSAAANAARTTQKNTTSKATAVVVVVDPEMSTSKSRSNEGCCLEDEKEDDECCKPKKEKHRHRFSGRNHAPLIQIPDASTRLDRLNTRRWNTRQRRQRRRRRQSQNNDGGDNNDSDNDNDNDTEIIYTANHNNLTTISFAEGEWEKTVSENNDDDGIRDNHNYRSIMDLPLLRFYSDDDTTATTQSHNNNCINSNQQLFRAGTTCLASYPRSGNTLLRSLLESVTGFVTASDTRPDRNLSVALAEKPPYFVGEGLAPPSSKGGVVKQQQQQQLPPPFLPPWSNEKGFLLPPPPICKTHWPERIGCHSYDCHRVVLLIRNPFDATDSYWHMNLTKTHTEKVKPHVTNEHKSFYEALVRHEILQVWISFLDYYWRECSKRNVPLLLVRYEDLILRPRDELQRILEFCCDGDGDGDGDEENRKDWWKKRLEEVTRDDDDDAAAAASDENNETGGVKYGYRSSSSAAEDPIEENGSSAIIGPGIDGSTSVTDTSSNCTTTSSDETHKKCGYPSESSSNSHPSIGRSLRKGMFPQALLKAIHEFDDRPLLRNNRRDDEDGSSSGKWLERLGYHVYKQGFPNNLDNLPPIPVLKTKTIKEGCATSAGDGDSRNGSLAINIQDVSLELRPRDSPYGRNMRRWRRKRTANDTEPFPTI